MLRRTKTRRRFPLSRHSPRRALPSYRSGADWRAGQGLLQQLFNRNAQPAADDPAWSDREVRCRDCDASGGHLHTGNDIVGKVAVEIDRIEAEAGVDLAAGEAIET